MDDTRHKGDTARYKVENCYTILVLKYVYRCQHIAEGLLIAVAGIPIS